MCAAKSDVRFTPIATAKADIRERPCPLYPRKRTLDADFRMSTKGQLRTMSYRADRPPDWRAHRYARVAATPSNVRMACSFPHNISKARDFGPASDVGIASSLWFVGIMPMRV